MITIAHPDTTVPVEEIQPGNAFSCNGHTYIRVKRMSVAFKESYAEGGILVVQVSGDPLEDPEEWRAFHRGGIGWFQKGVEVRPATITEDA